MASRQPLLPNWWEKKHTILSAVGGALVIVGIIAAVHFSGNADDITWSDDEVENFLAEEVLAKRFPDSVGDLIEKLKANAKIPCAKAKGYQLRYVSTNTIITMEKVDLQFPRIQTLTPAKSSPGRWNPLVKCDVTTIGKYFGQVDEKDRRHGVGKYVDKSDGGRYEGQWDHGKATGIGDYRYQNGDTYLGQMTAGKFHGKGKFTDKLAEKSYSGEWVNDKMKGMVTITSKNGDSELKECSDIINPPRCFFVKKYILKFCDSV
eukprot:640180_1